MNTIDSTFGELKGFKDSARLVKDLGEIEIDGARLRDYLKIKEVSLWDLVAPLLACYSFPGAILQSRQQASPLRLCKYLFQKRIKPYLKHFRDCVRNYVEIVKFQDRSFGEQKKKRVIKALFLIFEPRHHREIFAPLEEIMNNERRVEIKAIGSKYRAAQENFVKRDLRFIEDFYNSNLAREVRNGKKAMAARIRKVEKVLLNKIKILYPNERNFLRDELLSFFVWECSSLIKQIVIAGEIINLMKPDIIIGGDDCDPRARVYFLMGKNKKIPTLLIQQGLAVPKISVEWFFLSVNKAAIFGDYTKRVLEEIGVDSTKLVVTGQPRFDRLVRKGNDKERLCKRIGIDPQKKIILFTSQPNVPGAFATETVRRNSIEVVYSLMKRLDDTVLIVKPHPDEAVRFHRYMISKINSKGTFVIDKNANTHELIMACDLLMTFHSTTALEAMIADKPVLIVNLSKHTQGQYVKSGAALEACSGDEAVFKIGEIFNDETVKSQLREASRRFVLEHAYNMDGKASERIADLIFEMVKR